MLCPIHLTCVSLLWQSTPVLVQLKHYAKKTRVPRWKALASGIINGCLKKAVDVAEARAALDAGPGSEQAMKAFMQTQRESARDAWQKAHAQRLKEKEESLRVDEDGVHDAAAPVSAKRARSSDDHDDVGESDGGDSSEEETRKPAKKQAKKGKGGEKKRKKKKARRKVSRTEVDAAGDDQVRPVLLVCCFGSASHFVVLLGVPQVTTLNLSDLED